MADPGLIVRGAQRLGENIPMTSWAPIPPNGESQDGKKYLRSRFPISDFEIAFLGAAAAAAVD